MRGKKRSNIGPQGIATVRKLKDGIRVVYDDTPSNTNPNETFDIIGEDVWKDDRPVGVFRVTLNDKKDRLVGINALPGVYVVSFEKFGKRDATDVPQPWIMRGGPRTSKSGSTWMQPDSMKFTFVLKIHDSQNLKNDGLTATGMLSYIFERDQITGDTYYTGTGWEMETLELFLKVAGFDFLEDEIPYAGNILPQLEELLQSRNVKFQAEINEKGFVIAKSFGPHLAG
jgi:hypothetical protein